MRIIAFVTEPLTLRAILAQLGEPTAPPRIAPARGLPLWEAAVPALTGHTPPEDPPAQPEPTYELRDGVSDAAPISATVRLACHPTSARDLRCRRSRSGTEGRNPYRS
jgi:hypothetical protein